MTPVPTSFKRPIARYTALALIADTEANHTTNHVREDFLVTEDFRIFFGAYEYHFNKGNNKDCIPDNIGYTYISAIKYSKVDVLRMFGGDALVSTYNEWLASIAPPPQAVKRGSVSKLFRKIHGKARKH